MPLLQAGFSLSDVERICGAEDVRTLVSVLVEVQKQGEVARLLRKLDIAEACNAAFVGSQSGRENQTAYGRWLRGVEMKVMKLQGQAVHTIWDARRKSRRLGR